MDSTNNSILISIEDFVELMDLKTRVSVLIERIAHDEYFKTEDVLRVLGTCEAVQLADELREKEAERIRRFRSEISEGVDEAGD